MIVEIGSPEWYYERFPGFYNNRCYEILSEWYNGVPNEDVHALPEGMKFLEGKESDLPTMRAPPTKPKNKKPENYRKRKCLL